MSVRIKHMINEYYIGWSEVFDAPGFGGTKKEAELFWTRRQAKQFILDNSSKSPLCYPLANCLIEKII